jgi:hypothetical protein
MAKEGEGETQVDFKSFVLSLAAPALLQLKEEKEGEKDLTTSRQTIEALALLKEKTRGNLTPEETSLLENLLYDLRMRYLKARGHLKL